MHKLNSEQLKQLAEFCTNLSIVFFGATLTPFFTSVDNMNALVLVFSLIGGIGSLLMSLLLLKGREVV